MTAADPCAMPVGYGQTCPLPGDHDGGCQPPDRDWFEQAMNLPGATLDNAVDPDVIGAYGLEPDHEAAGDDRPEPTRCKCSHIRANHTRGTGQCWSAACGCAEFREKASA